MSADRVAGLARRLTGSNRWLIAAVLALLVVATVLPPTTGSARNQRLLDLASGPTTTGPESLAPPELLPPALEPLVSGLPPVGGAPAEVAPVTSGPADGSGPIADAPPLGPSAEEPCASAAIVDAISAAEASIEAAAGPLPVDVTQLFANLAGCGAGGNPLDALGVIGQLLHVLGIERIPLPALPVLPLPAPPPGFDALGPTVLPVCAEVIQQLVTVAALAPFARIDTREVVALFDPVIQVCALFAPKA